MRAKEYLEQIQRLDIMIQNKSIELEQWWAMATNMVSAASGDKVQSSGNMHKMESAVDNYMEIEEEIKQRLKELAAKKQEIISMIERLPTIDYDILHKIYVQGLTLIEVADTKERGYSWVTTIHGRALKRLQRLIDEKKA